MIAEVFRQVENLPHEFFNRLLAPSGYLMGSNANGGVSFVLLNTELQHPHGSLLIRLSTYVETEPSTVPQVLLKTSCVPSGLTVGSVLP